MASKSSKRTEKAREVRSATALNNKNFKQTIADLNDKIVELENSLCQARKDTRRWRDRCHAAETKCDKIQCQLLDLQIQNNNLKMELMDTQWLHTLIPLCNEKLNGEIVQKRLLLQQRYTIMYPTLP